MASISLPRSIRNPLSALGALVALVAMLVGGVLLVVHYFEPRHNPYFGIFLFLVVPGFLFAGIVMVPLGAIRARRRRLSREGAAEGAWPLLDLNRPAHRNAFVLFSAAAAVMAVLSALGSYGAYHYSESVEFCGATCHVVMEPEYTTYQRSPHARVSCASCHIGSGADWFVKSKLSGAYQVYAVVADRFPRPIPTPIESLRPAQQTCEQCHWPGKVFGAQLKRLRHALYDEANTEWPIDLLIKTGGNDPSSGAESGIHWHMNLGVEVEYVARDARRQEIPWVRVRDRKTGRVTVYQDRASPLSAEELAAAEPRRMDCLDCHNRPSHQFLAPDAAIDRALRDGTLERALPSVKRFAVEALAKEYDTRERAMAGIASDLSEAYRKEYPGIWNGERGRVDRAIEAVQATYRATIFPEMGARWSAYPDDIGHFDDPGCMRCHDGEHVSETGAVVRRDCNVCHTILAQGAGDRYATAASPEGLVFDHPEEIGDAWQETGCWECHPGTRP
jgi:hypothetical protein